MVSDLLFWDAANARLQGAQDTSAAMRPAFGSLLPADITRELQTARLGRGTIFYAPQMGSTNTELKKAASARTLAQGSLAVCDQQTDGRGRLNRAWADTGTADSLTCSVLLRPKLSQEQTPLITLVVAIAAVRAIADTAGLKARVKWPNDVVLDARKCVGILCEGVLDPAGAWCVVVGAGFNVNQQGFSGELAAKATSLFAQSGQAYDRRALLCSYLKHLEELTDVLEKDGWAALYPAYVACSVTLGSRVRVESALETFTGLAERIDDAGALWVRLDDGTTRRVLSGDVSVRGVMGYV